MKFVEFFRRETVDFPTHKRHVEHKPLGLRRRRFDSILQKRAEQATDTLFVPFLPELRKLPSNRRFKWLPVADGVGLVELVGTRLALGLSSQVEEVGL